MSSTGVDPSGSVRVRSGPPVRVAVSPDWRERLGFPGGELGAAVVAAYLAAMPVGALTASAARSAPVPAAAVPLSSGVGSRRSSPAVEGDVGEDLRGTTPQAAAGVLHAALLDVAERLSAARSFAAGPVTVTLSAGVVTGMTLDPGWLAGAAVSEINSAVASALRRAAGTGADPVLVEATRLGADPVGLMRALGVG